MASELIRIVDAIPISLKLTRMMFLRAGYKVLTAASTDEAVAALRRDHPRVVQVFHEPGVDTMVLAKQDQWGRLSSVVVSAASAIPAEEQDAIHACCDSLIAEP